MTAPLVHVLVYWVRSTIIQRMRLHLHPLCIYRSIGGTFYVGGSMRIWREVNEDKSC